jgi:hypothetical protein
VYVFENNIPRCAPMWAELTFLCSIYNWPISKKNIGQAILVGKCCHCRINLYISAIFACCSNSGLGLQCLMPLSTIFQLYRLSWLSILLVEETGVPGKNHRPAVSHWQTLSQNVYRVHLANGIQIYNSNSAD